MSGSTLESLVCTKCEGRYDDSSLHALCPSCRGVLDTRYDLALVSSKPGKSGGIWRWNQFLPVLRLKSVVTVGEGETPLRKATRLADQLELKRLFVKDETRNPTGCFKDRGAAVTASKLKEHRVKEAVIASEGNASCSLALYASLAGFRCHAFVPRLISPAKKNMLRVFGADVKIVDGTLADAGREAAAESERTGWYNASTFITPYRHDGKGTMAWEMLEQLDWTAPDVIVYPVGGGVGLVGMWKAFKYAHQLGWSESTPRMIGVQPEGCAPVVRAFKEGKSDVEAWSNPSTIATGLLVPRPLGGSLILHSLRESKGTAVAVSDAAIQRSMREVARSEDILLEPSAAAAFAALPRLIDEGVIAPSDTTVVIATGSGLKTLEHYDY